MPQQQNPYSQTAFGQYNPQQMQSEQQKRQQQLQQEQLKQQIRQQYQGTYSQLSTKDFNYLKDHLSWELLAVKKCAHYAAECQDPQVARLINEVGKMHERHYNTLLQYLDPHTIQ